MESKAAASLMKTLEGIATVPQNFLADLNSLLTEEIFYKNQELPAKGSQKTAVYYIVSGLVKSGYFGEKGAEIVTGFWWETSFLISKQSNKAHEAESYTFLEDTILLALPAYAADLLLDHHRVARKISVQIYAQERARLKGRAHLLSLPVSQAYEVFKQNFPSTRLKLQDIARYLAIRPFTLSRIRNDRS